MATQGPTQGFPNPASPIVDPQTGQMAEPFMRLILALYNKTGGSGSNSITYTAPEGEFLVSIDGTVVGSAQVQFSELGGTLGPEQLPSLLPQSLLANASPNPGPTANPTFSGFLDEVISPAPGEIIQRGGEVWQGLAPGTAGQVLTSAGPGALLEWGSASIEIISGSETLSSIGTITLGSGLTLAGALPSATISTEVALQGYSGDGTLASAGTCLIANCPSNSGWTFPAGLTNSVFRLAHAPTSAWAGTLSAGGSSVGTISFGAASTTATISVSGSFTVAAGAQLVLVGPSAVDAGFKGLASVIVGKAV